MRKSIWRKLFGSFLKLVFPAILLIVVAAFAGAFWLVHHASAEPPRAAYLVTPERLAQFTKNGQQFTDETWSNSDNTSSRGWLVRGNPNAPAVILLHRYGADRSWLLNLGVKMNQTTGFTVLIPDLRGHGEQPTVKRSSFGGCEADDLTSAISYLNSLKDDQGAKLVGSKIGVYGVETGAIAALFGAANSKEISALALDSVPASSDEMLQSVVGSRVSFTTAAVAPLAQTAAPLYFIRGCYKNTPVCEAAASLSNHKVLLLAGKDAPRWQESTVSLASCFSRSTDLQKKTDLEPSGYNLLNIANSGQQQAYNVMVIDFFRSALQ